MLNELNKMPFTGTVFVFRPKRAGRLTQLYWDGSGLVMTYKRLEAHSFVWPAISNCILSLNHGVVYNYAPGRGGDHAETFLKGFDCILQIDGYAGYNRLAKPEHKDGDPIRFAYCWAHCRRKLREIFDRDGSEIAAEGLRRIAMLYAIEAENRGFAPDQRLVILQARNAPLVADFEIWLVQQKARGSAKSRLGKKLGYIARH